MSTLGEGLGVLVNANAKRGGRRVAVQIARAVPEANVRLTRTADEVDRWLRELHEPRALFPAGGDGTVVALINALARVWGDRPFPPIGILPLGTGNAWAHVVGAPKLDQALKLLMGFRGPIPTRRFGIIRCEGALTPFAGAGWEAEILNDYRAQVSHSRGPSKWLTKSVYGYLAAGLFRTAPKTAVAGRPRVIIENLGDAVYTVTADRKLLKLHGVGRGAVLYDGLASVVGCSVTPELGYGVRGYPFAERFLGMMNVRVYDQTALGAVLRLRDIWRGTHPLPGMYDWFASSIRMTFSRPVPLQIAGDAAGYRQTVELGIVEREVSLIDWRSLY